ncbi:MAG: CBS domain-containing protein [Gammaproteobacteria bacterium]|nr:CBS domain-containing protein [Gammaproteobacteria bacterium]
MTKVENLIGSKGGDIWGVQPDTSVFDAIKLMDDKGIGAVVVLLDGELIGIMSERDYARKVVLKDRLSKETLVKEIMTRSVYHTFPEQSVDECMAVMTKHRIRHLPVMQDGKVVGMISIGDVVKDIIAEQQDKIEHLEHCITWAESY